MESSAFKSIKSVCAKAEPCENVCIADEPTVEGVSVKVESFMDDVCLVDEPRCESSFIKPESSCSDVCVKDESLGQSAAAGLYTDHVVKDELVLGPVLVERRSVRHAPTADRSEAVMRDCQWEAPSQGLLCEAGASCCGHPAH
ncbi:uncharacterized protein LOC133532595 isoform X3 [Cydia pomonella]|uniref:uncharacterized protein LOC133532595 isoform X3 n=1 Tax=Cydia pomonella TaxID=82600 RepID=UPI002ADE6D2D|nr:uncharacterized protein LOC133532595 isoform X3 [Cydia pomonella]